MASRKPLEMLDPSQITRRQQAARARLLEAVESSDLRGADIAKVLEEAKKVDLVFETKEFWARKMEFAQDLSDTMASVWDADLAVDIRDQYGLSERIMDGIRFDMAHETINGRPHRRRLVTNAFTKKSLPFPTPIKARCEWTARMRDREAAMELIEREGADTCERDFDATLDALIERDQKLLRGGFSAARPFAFVVSFDGADNLTHVTLRLTDYKEGVAEESELKIKQLAVTMGDDHYPRLERVVAPLIGPAAAARTSVTISGTSAPSMPTMCLDYSAAGSAFGRRAGKLAHCECEDVQALPMLPTNCDAKRAFQIVDGFCKWLTVSGLRNDAHSPSAYPFKCRRRGCKSPLIKDAAHREVLKAELAALKADKSVKGKAAYAKAIAIHCDAHGQQMPYQTPVMDIPLIDLIGDLLHGLDLNLPKVLMKYSILDPRILTLDMRSGCADFFSEIGCSLDVREKADRDNSKKWFHGSVWHYDFVKGANKKSYGLHTNIFQLCLIVYGVDRPTIASTAASAAASTAGSTAASASAAVSTAGSKRKATSTPSAIIDDLSSDDDSDSDDGDGAAGADLNSDAVLTELRASFGVNAPKVKTILSGWNSYADLYNACCDEWTSDTDAYREERGFQAMKAAFGYLDKLNDVSTRRHKCRYGHLFATVIPRQMRRWGDLWRFSTRSVEGRGGRLKHIGRRMICWRRRSAKYRRVVKAKGGGSRIIVQSYDSAPERQLMRAACSREDRTHTQVRSRVATTGRNTLKRSFGKLEEELLPELGDALEPKFIKKMCLAAGAGTGADWRA